jgi:hypothetical protein
MKLHTHRLVSLLAAGAGLLLLGAPRGVTAGPTLVPPGAPRSEFVDDVEFGKDPFFPASSRRPKIMVKPSDNEPPRPTVPDFVVLKGISTFQGKKLAIINNYTVGEGEEVSLKTGGQPLRIKCVEIKEKSVVVSVSGATKEILLRGGF